MNYFYYIQKTPSAINRTTIVFIEGDSGKVS
jgi:hypothetical protein